MVKVYPTSPASLVLRHPIDGQLKPDGSDWTLDGFTCRMLADHAVTETPPTKPETSVAEKMK